MGSSESTGRSNGTGEEEERQPENNRGKAIAIAAAGTAVAAWGISRMLSGSKGEETQETGEAMTIKASGTEAYRLNSSNRLESESVEKSTWSPPPRGRFKMNTDGSTLSHLNKHSGYGGILRDCHGKWVRGFRGYIGVSDNLTAEIRGIHEGLKLLDKLGLRESILESDSQAAVEWMEQRDDEPSKSKIICDCWGIIKESRRLIDKNEIKIKHVSRDANKCADKLADMAIESREEYVDLMNRPAELRDIV